MLVRGISFQGCHNQQLKPKRGCYVKAIIDLSLYPVGLVNKEIIIADVIDNFSFDVINPTPSTELGLRPLELNSDFGIINNIGQVIKKITFVNESTKPILSASFDVTPPYSIAVANSTCLTKPIFYKRMCTIAVIADSTNLSVGEHEADIKLTMGINNQISSAPINAKVTVTGNPCIGSKIQVNGSCVLQNQSRVCLAQPANSVNGLEYSIDGAQNWGSCVGFSCINGREKVGEKCLIQTTQVFNESSIFIPNTDIEGVEYLIVGGGGGGGGGGAGIGAFPTIFSGQFNFEYSDSGYVSTTADIQVGDIVTMPTIGYEGVVTGIQSSTRITVTPAHFLNGVNHLIYVKRNVAGAGGGGGGGVSMGSIPFISSGSYPVVVGSGGIGKYSYYDDLSIDKGKINFSTVPANSIAQYNASGHITLKHAIPNTSSPYAYATFDTIVGKSYRFSYNARRISTAAGTPSIALFRVVNGEILNNNYETEISGVNYTILATGTTSNSGHDGFVDFTAISSKSTISFVIGANYGEWNFSEYSFSMKSNNTEGQPSSIFGLSAAGGGAGLGDSFGPIISNGFNGGGAFASDPFTVGLGDGQGFSGGQGLLSVSIKKGGGGGGAMSAGLDASINTRAGDGGAGVLSDIVGGNISYGGGGGGGDGGTIVTSGKNGIPNSGGGGGAPLAVGRPGRFNSSGSGGSGVVIIKYYSP